MAAQQSTTPVPTIGALAERTPTQRPTETAAPTFTPSATFTPSVTPTPSITSTPEKVDHYLLRRPISSSGVDYADRTYPYGSTQKGNRPVHLGQDYVNPRFTPVLAAAAGTVLYAGSDHETLFGPQNDYYGNLVVIEHGFTSPDGLPVYTLYGHLQRIEVSAGQRVEQGDQVGTVGDAGVAIGPHLHFEVRLGNPQDFRSTRNPDLWIYPYRRFGTLAGRVVNQDGSLAYGVTLQIRAADKIRYAYSYADDTVNGDPVWDENFTLGDLPEGLYEVIVSERNGRLRFRQMVDVKGNETTWMDVPLN